jgi:hypothetical protein
MRNRYLVTRSGGWVADRTKPFLYFLGPILVSPILLVAAAALEVGLLAAFAFLLLILGVVLGWVFLLKGGSGVKTAGEAWLAGDPARAIPLCQSALATVFRSDVRTKAFHILGLCAEANGDFHEALDLFDRVIGMVPAFGTATNKKRAQILVQSHRALCLVALGRIDDADAAVRVASMAFAAPTPQSALSSLLLDDEAFGTAGVNAALAQMEPGRDPRALLTLATVVLLAARGMAKEAIDIVARERMTVGRGLLPREIALLRSAETRARRALAGGVHRVAEAPEEAVDPWAARVLAVAR